MAYIYGTTGNDKGDDRVISSGRADHLFGDAGDDELDANGGNDTLEGGTGNDTLSGGSGSDLFIYANGDGNDIITDYEEVDTIHITSGTVSKVSTNSSGHVIFKVGTGQITVQNAADKIVTYIDAEGNTNLYPINTNAAGTAATLLAAYGKDDFKVADYDDFSETLKNIDASKVEHDLVIVGNKLANKIIGTGQDDTIDGGAGADNISGGAGNDSILGGAGNDNLNGGAGADLINGGAGNDTIEGGTGNDKINGGDGDDLFIYNSGDGNDIIYNYEEGDKIKIASGTTINTTHSAAGDLIITVDKGKITVKDVADKAVTYINPDGETIKIEPNIAVRYNTAGTAATLTAGYTDSSFTATGALVTVDASAVESAIKITGTAKANRLIGSDQDDYIEGLGGADNLFGNDGNDTFVGGVGNDKFTGGDGADVFVYANGDGNDLINDYEEEDLIKITSGTISNVATSGSNVIFTVGSGKITVKGAADKIVAYEDASGTKHFHPISINNAGTAATLKAAYNKDEFKFTDLGSYGSTLVTLDASAVENAIKITGTAKANRIIGSDQDDYIDGGAGADNLFGNDGNDTFVGGKGNDKFTGGDGADVFVYNNGDGNDLINDYEEEDLIKIASGTISKVATSGSNVIFTVGSGKISVKGGADKIVAYEDASGTKHFYPVDINAKGTAATLTSAYGKDEFNFADFGSYGSTLVTLDASAVESAIKITGSAKANRIIGSDQDDYIDGGAGADNLFGNGGNDTFVGGTGNDKFTGGDGADVFVYNNGDGNDLINDYEAEDVIKIASGTVTTTHTAAGDLIFTVGTGKISVKGGAQKSVTYINPDDEPVVIKPNEPTIYNAKETAVTLTSAYDQESYTALSTIVTVDASAVERDLKITGNAKANRIIGSDQDETLDGGAGADKIFGNAGNDSILGGAGNDSLNGGAGADLINGGTGNDTIEGGTGNDKMNGGDGDDLFIYNNGDGSDIIYNYEESDKIKIASGTISTTYSSAGDLVFTVGKGKITVKDVADKAVTYINPDDETIKIEPNIAVRYNTAGTAATLTSAYTDSSFTASSALVTIDATAVENEIEITGNAKANRILGSDQGDYIKGLGGNDKLIGNDGDDSLKGGAGNDSILGGTGNDTLWSETGTDTLIGGDGNDTFLFQAGEGNTVIEDYLWGTDTIMILSGKVDNAEAVSSDVVFTMASGETLTLKNASGRSAEVVDTSGNILKQYKYRG